MSEAVRTAAQSLLITCKEIRDEHSGHLPCLERRELCEGITRLESALSAQPADLVVNCPKCGPVCVESSHAPEGGDEPWQVIKDFDEAGVLAAEVEYYLDKERGMKLIRVIGRLRQIVMAAKRCSCFIHASGRNKNCPEHGDNPAKPPAPEGTGRDEEWITRVSAGILGFLQSHQEITIWHPDFMKKITDKIREHVTHTTSESGRIITPWNCPKVHWGIVDCKSCGLTYGEQPDFPAIVPERFKAIDPSNGPFLKECNESLAKLISDVWAALEPTGEYEGEKNLVEFAKSIRVAKESAEWSLARIPELEQQIAALRAESGRVEEQGCGHVCDECSYAQASQSQPSVKDKL